MKQLEINGKLTSNLQSALQRITDLEGDEEKAPALILPERFN